LFLTPDALRPKADWIVLDSEAQLDELFRVDAPEGQLAVAVFKHSTRCSISRAVFRRLREEWVLPAGQVPLYFLDLLEFRALSGAITERSGTVHESPQLLLLQQGQVILNRSHSEVHASEVSKLLGLG
jgi:bacillithiol system protein YtxJ